METKIVLYSTGCPKCNVLIQKLNNAGVEYTISQDIDELIARGFNSVPVLQAPIRKLGEI